MIFFSLLQQDVFELLIFFSLLQQDVFELLIFFSLLQQDVFELEAVSLDEVERIVVSHDKKGSQPSWFLDKVIIRSDDNPDKDYRFNCGRSEPKLQLPQT